jgi:DNA-binding HxlR family transcriptional regulator
VKEDISPPTGHSDPDALDLALDLVGDRWSLRVIEALLSGPQRYGELSTSLRTIAPNVLAARLRTLEQAGLVHARPYQERPRRLQYELTPDGAALSPIIGALRQWTAARFGIGESAIHDRCGTPVTHSAWCPTCRESMPTRTSTDVVWL